MKVKFKNLLMGYTGVADDSVIYFSPKLGQYIIRRRPKFKEMDHHRRFGEIQKQLFAIDPSAQYRQDIRDYLKLYNALPAKRDKPILTWNALYVKMMWNMHYIMNVDLLTLDRDLALELPCRSISDAVEAGLLPRVKNYEPFSALI